MLRHIRDTGEPEAFPTISTARPPESGDVEVLAEKIDIPRGRRSDGADKAPCPLCSPTSPKFASGGMLVWCADTQAIYCIGPTCSTTSAWRRKVDEAVNRFREAEQAKQDAASLLANLQLAPARLDWIKTNRPRIAAADAAQAKMASEAPKLRHALSRRLKTGSAIDRVGNVGGGEFLTGLWHLRERLEATERELLDVTAELVGEPQAWVAALAPSQRRTRADRLRRVAEVLTEIVRLVLVAKAFMSPANASVLSRWAKSDDAPAIFDVSSTAGSITVRSGRETWQGTFLQGALTNLPSL